MNLENKRVLVTGAGGFIGSHLVEQLTKKAAHVRGMVHYNALGSRGWLDKSPVKNEVEIIAGNICDRDSVRQAMKDIDVVYHLAALIAIPYSYHSPLSYVNTNIEGTLNVLQNARDLGTERIVHTSTSEVYGTALYVPITEEHPLQGQSPYSATKIGADKLVESFYRSFEVPVVTMRPFNTYGPRQSMRAVIPTIMTQCLAGVDTISLGNLTPTRDFNFVLNTVDGFIKASEVDDAIGRTIHIGSGEEISIGDLAHLIAELADNPIKIQIDQSRLRPEGSEVDRLLASNAFAKEILNWEPIYSLREGLAQTIDWFRENLDKYRVHDYNI